MLNVKELKKIEEMIKVEGNMCNEKIEVKIDFNEADDTEIVVLIDDNKYKIFIEDGDIELNDLVYKIIQEIYAVDVNTRIKYNKDTKNFLYRKTKSISTWQRKFNDGKVAEIISEMTRRVKKDEKIRNEIYEYKQIISLLYNIKNKLEERTAI